MRFFVLALGVLLLTACVSPQEMMARQAAVDRLDCEDYGFTPGTELYAECRRNITRMKIDQNRETRQSIDQTVALQGALQGLNALSAQLQQQEALRRAQFEASRSRMTQTNCRRQLNGDVSCTTW